jgi:hypothetical protein
VSRKLTGLTLGACLVASAALLGQQPSVSDPEVAKGIKLVDEGDLDAAILTLDNAARRLAQDPAKAKDLSQAYLYLGIAYVGKGHEAAAKAKFREAVKQLKDVSLSPEKFPPRVIDLFEAAKEEAAKTAAAPAPAAPRKGGGGKKWLVIGGLGAAAAGGAAYALTRGESFPDTFYDEITVLLSSGSQPEVERTVGPAQAGAWSTEVSWTASSFGGASASLPVDVKLFVRDATGAIVASGILIEPTKRRADWSGSAGQQFKVKVLLEGSGSASCTVVTSGPPK